MRTLVLIMGLQCWDTSWKTNISVITVPDVKVDDFADSHVDSWQQIYRMYFLLCPVGSSVDSTQTVLQA